MINHCGFRIAANVTCYFDKAHGLNGYFTERIASSSEDGAPEMYFVYSRAPCSHKHSSFLFVYMNLGSLTHLLLC